MLLNFLFHISVSPQDECALAGARPQTPSFQDDRGAAWRRRCTVIGRPGLAVGEVLEDLRSAGVMDRPARLVARFEKYTLSLLIVSRPGGAVRCHADDGCPGDARSGPG